MEDDLEDEIEQADSFRDKIHLAIIEIDKVLGPRSDRISLSGRRLEEGTSTPSPTDRPSLETDRDGASSRSPGPKVKLLKIELKKFNGDVTNWITFWDSAIHSNNELSNVDKFNYLNSVLEQSAAEAISGLTLTSANYEEAVDILKRRFGNKQQIISKHMDIHLNLDAVSSQHNLKGLRHLFDLVESHVRELKSLGIPPEAYGSLLSSVLMNKLPSEFRLIISRDVKDDKWDLNALMTVMECEIDARERAATGPSVLPKRQSRDPLIAAVLLTRESGPTCSYCSQSHSSNTCRTVTNVETRK